MGQNQPVARKQDKKTPGLEGGQLSHNPFAALAGKPSQPAEGSIQLPGDGGDLGAGTPWKKPNKGKRKGSTTPASSGGGGKLTVRFEAKGHGGKTVTRITGLALDEQAKAALARDLKKAMGTGARVEGGDVLVQGKLVERVAQWLTKAGHGQVVRGN